MYPVGVKSTFRNETSANASPYNNDPLDNIRQFAQVVLNRPEKELPIQIKRLAIQICHNCSEFANSNYDESIKAEAMYIQAMVENKVGPDTNAAHVLSLMQSASDLDYSKATHWLCEHELESMRQ